MQADARQIPLKDQSVDAIITDPPYGIRFMGKAWDGADIIAQTANRARYSTDPSKVAGVRGGYRSIAAEAGKYDRTTTANQTFQEWCGMWALEALRVLKPGAYLLAFGGTRTFHRLTCAIEDAGFEIRDCINYLYGSGFPKSLDVSKAIDKAAGAEREIIDRVRPDGRTTGYSGGSFNACDVSKTNGPAITDAAKQWQGWGTALKPAWEPIIVARKPLQSTVAENVQEWGTGALNIDGCRIGTRGEDQINCTAKTSHAYGEIQRLAGKIYPADLGRWPANLILDEEAAALLDEQSGELTSGNNPARRSADKHRNVYAGWKGEQCLVHRGTDSGGASRFFYTAKADKTDRGEGNNHPTVKPQDLIEYLIKLVSRPGAIILDPFSGSGTTALVADKMNRIGIGMDLERKYCELGNRRCYDDAPLLAGV